uniref:Uncharacterized protein n=1 Tax=Scophthalmus maximus TaxID=52904 RepID=A0A8D3A6S8_SCOMX
MGLFFVQTRLETPDVGVSSFFRRNIASQGPGAPWHPWSNFFCWYDGSGGVYMTPVRLGLPTGLDGLNVLTVCIAV